MNKGLRLRFCKECKRKRFCSRISIRGHNFKYTCSKNHSWTLKGLTLERMNAVYQDIFTETRLKSLFERDDTFYSVLKK